MAERLNPKYPSYVSKAGYVYVKAPGHQHATNNGYIAEHILIAERALGRPLPPGSQVHHVNTNKADNNGANLVICENASYHRLLHRRAAICRAGGDPNVHKMCSRCGLSSLSKFGVSSRSFDGLNNYCRPCAAYIVNMRNMRLKHDANPDGE